MSKFVVVGIRALRRRIFISTLVLFALPWATRAVAAPDFAPLAPVAAAASAADAVSQFLVAKGLMPAVDASTGVVGSSDAGFVTRIRDKASDMVLTAMNFLGVPYRRGGNTVDSGFDCSGFTRQVFETSLGLVLPRRADEQAHAPGLVAVKRDELQPGDLVFFNTLRRTFSHVGIYVGDGKFIHSPKPGGEVRVEDMRFSYWTTRFTGGRRAEPMVDPQASIELEPSVAEAIESAEPAAPLAHRSQRKHARAKH